MKKYQTWLLIAFITLFALYFLFYKQSDTEQAQKSLKDNQPQARGAATISADEAINLANKLQGAMEGLGTDEDTINAVILQIQTSKDAKMIDSAFNIRNRQSLGAWLQNDGYFTDFTQQLNEKGVNYTPPIINRAKWYEFG